MNKVYKVLFNKSTGKYVVVSENSKSAKKSSKTIQSIVLAAVAFGGTSIIIVVGVVLETLKQIESQLLVRNYKGFLNS
mgnify:CR=1 FL=1